MIAFLLLNAVLLLATVLSALGAGTAGARTLRLGKTPAALRVAAGLALLGTLSGLLGIARCLTPAAMVVVITLDCVLALLDSRPASVAPGALLIAIAVAVPLYVLALYPPLAFDETLYHLPTVRAFADSGALPFLPHLRTAVFPHLDEVLRVPLFVFGGEPATHLISLVATIVTAAIVFAWVSEIASGSTAAIAAALFVSGPIVVQLATTGYVEALLTMLVTASFYSFERWRRSSDTGWLAASAIFGASAADVKYLGLFWLAVVAAGVALVPGRRRVQNLLLFAAAAIAMLAPWYGRIIYYTGNPVFPYAGAIFGHSAWDAKDALPQMPFLDRMISVARLPWDTLFARSRVNYQPPFSPFLIATIPLIAIQAFRDIRVRLTGSLALAYAIFWSFLPHDARYLEPALALTAVAGALSLDALVFRSTSWRRFRALIAILIVLPAPLYAMYRIRDYGPPPAGPAARDEWLKHEVPEFPAIAWMNARASHSDVAYVCGGEHLAAYFRGTLIGDLTGPARYDLATTAPSGGELARRLDALGVRQVLVVKSRCTIPAIEKTPFYSRVYEDPLTVVYARSVSRL